MNTAKMHSTNSTQTWRRRTLLSKRHIFLW